MSVFLFELELFRMRAHSARTRNGLFAARASRSSLRRCLPVASALRLLRTETPERRRLDSARTNSRLSIAAILSAFRDDYNRRLKNNYSLPDEPPDHAPTRGTAIRETSNALTRGTPSREYTSGQYRAFPGVLGNGIASGTFASPVTYESVR